MNDWQIAAIEARARAWPLPAALDIRALAKEARRRVQLERTLTVIPVRLTGGRKAHLELPDPLTAEDAEHLKRWIDLQVATAKESGTDAQRQQAE